MKIKPSTMPMIGATTMKMRVLYQPSGMMTENMMRRAGMDGGVHHGGAGVAADQGVRGGRGQAPPPGEQIPDDGAEQPGQDDVLIDVFQANHAAADGLGDGSAEEKSSQKIKSRRPQHGEPGGQHARGDHGRDAVGGIVEAVEEVEDQGDQDRDQDEDDVLFGSSTLESQQSLGLGGGIGTVKLEPSMRS